MSARKLRWWRRGEPSRFVPIDREDGRDRHAENADLLEAALGRPLSSPPREPSDRLVRGGDSTIPRTAFGSRGPSPRTVRR